MKCGIIKDLLPSYIDQLTCEDSNQEVEKHLVECQECNKYYRQMLPIEKEAKEEQKDLDLLKSFKRKRRGLIAMLCIIIVAAIAFISIGYLQGFTWTWIPVPYEKAQPRVIVFTEHENHYEVGGEIRIHYGQALYLSDKMMPLRDTGHRSEIHRLKIDGEDLDVVLFSSMTTLSQYFLHKDELGDPALVLTGGSIWDLVPSELEDISELDRVYYLDKNADLTKDMSEEKILEWIEKYGHLVWSKDMVNLD